MVNKVDDESVKHYFEEKDKLHQLLLHEETYWKQRAKVFWLEEGDYNVNIRNEDRIISNEQNEALTVELTFEEFTLAVKQMHLDKASGPDGLNPAFLNIFGSSLVVKCS